MKAYKRIKQMALVIDSLAKQGDSVADIACDHGYLAELLNRNPKFVKVYATDISKKCLQKVEKLKKDFNLDKVVTLLGDGLEPLEKIDIAAIAGVGGLETIKMITKQNKLETGENKCSIFVLQPAQNVFEFRKWLFENEIYVISDYFVEDAKKFYPIIAIDVSKTQKNEMSLYNLYIGRDNDKTSETFKKFLIYSKQNFAYLENLTKETIEKDELLREKFEIYSLVKTLLK